MLSFKTNRVMSRLIRFSVGMVLLLAVMVSCKDTAFKVYEGRIFDASMNDIVIITGTGDTVTVSTMNADPAKVPGVFINDSVRVTCSDRKVGEDKILTADSLVILVRSPYYCIQGTWLEPNPIDTAQMQGFVLKQDGTAESVNMATLDFRSWTLKGHMLILQYTSIGNKLTIEGSDTLHIVKINADSLVLSANNRMVWDLVRKK